jgi:hypothetical protein
MLSTGCEGVTNHETETSSAVTTEAATEATTETSEATAESATEITEATTEATADVTTQNEANIEVTAEPTSINDTDDETQSSTDQTAPTIEQAKELIRALSMMERLVGASLQYDAETVCTVNGIAYYKVTDTDFASTEDIRRYEKKYLTNDMISERYSAVVDGDTPIYADTENGLCMKDSAKGFYIFSDTEPNIEKTSEEGYSILADYDNFGAKETADIRIINVNGTWKICGISFGL